MCDHFDQDNNMMIVVKIFAKKILWICLGIFMVHMMLTCRVDAENNTSIPKAKPKKSIAIIQIVEHESLDQAHRGIINGLCQNGYKEDVNLDILYQSAQGSSTTASQIVQQFIVQNPSAIIAIGTPAAQAALQACRVANIPVIFSSVTDPKAAGLIHHQMTGSLDFPRLGDNLNLIQQFVPTIKKLGIIYSAAEINSVKVINDLRELVKPFDIELVESAVINSSQVNSALSGLIGKVDAIYLPSDSTVFSAIDTVVKIARQNLIPVFSNDPDSIRKGILAGIGYDQIDVGYLAGELTAQIFDGMDITDLPARIPQDCQLYINQDTFDILNETFKFELVDHVKNKAVFVK